MNRRTFVGAVTCGVLVSLAARAQRATTVRRIGRLEPGAPDTPDEMRQEAEPLRQLGWVEGENLLVERRYANHRSEALEPLAEELVRAKVEIIVTGGHMATLAAKRATTTIPIIFHSAGDPVGGGLVPSLAQPEGNVTGFSLNYPELMAKNLSLLKELMPRVQRIGSIGWATEPWRTSLRRKFEQTCRSLGIEPVFADIVATGEIEGAIAQLARQRVQALVLRSDVFVFERRFDIVRAAMRHGLPTMAEQLPMVLEAGALAAYSTTQAEEDRRAASYVDRILRGAKPADLPVEQPTKYQLAINLKTARVLDLTIPQSLLLRADEVIQ